MTLTEERTMVETSHTVTAAQPLWPKRIDRTSGRLFRSHSLLQPYLVILQQRDWLQHIARPISFLAHHMNTHRLIINRIQIYLCSSGRHIVQHLLWMQWKVDLTKWNVKKRFKFNSKCGLHTCKRLHLAAFCIEFICAGAVCGACAHHRYMYCKYPSVAIHPSPFLHRCVCIANIYVCRVKKKRWTAVLRFVSCCTFAASQHHNIAKTSPSFTKNVIFKCFPCVEQMCLPIFDCANCVHHDLLCIAEF